MEGELPKTPAWQQERDWRPIPVIAALALMMAVALATKYPTVTKATVLWLTSATELMPIAILLLAAGCFVLLREKLRSSKYERLRACRNRGGRHQLVVSWQRPAFGALQTKHSATDDLPGKITGAAAGGNGYGIRRGLLRNATRSLKLIDVKALPAGRFKAPKHLQLHYRAMAPQGLGALQTRQCRMADTA